MLEKYLELAIRAHRGTSFSPEKRGENLIKSYSDELREDMEEKDDQYRERYEAKFTKWLEAKSRCMSSMITGPANFPVDRNRKRLDTEHKRYEEFRAWRERQFRKKVEKADPIDSIKQTISYFADRTLDRSLLKASIQGKLKRLANNGEVEDVERGLALCEEIFTKRSQVWGYVELAKRARENKGGESQVKQFDGFQVVVNRELNRVQIIHESKPERSIINDLKAARFNWSRKNTAWQRILTRNAMDATRDLLKKWDVKF